MAEVVDEVRLVVVAAVRSQRREVSIPELRTAQVQRVQYMLETANALERIWG